MDYRKRAARHILSLKTVQKETENQEGRRDQQSNAKPLVLTAKIKKCTQTPRQTNINPHTNGLPPQLLLLCTICLVSTKFTRHAKRQE